MVLNLVENEVGDTVGKGEIHPNELKNSIDIDFTHFMKINSISRPIVKCETKNLLEHNREENLDDTAFNDDFYV